MSNYAFPTQNRYSDPYQQRITDYGTIYKQKYLSRVSNLNLKSIADNVVLKGMDFTSLTYVGSVITAIIGTGALLSDTTLIETSASATLDIDVSGLDDTSTGGCHLGIFTNFQYIESPDADSQTPMALHLYHISADGLTVTPSGFTLAKNKLLIGCINFTKSGVNVTAVNLNNTIALSVLDSTFYPKGYNEDNLNFYDMFDRVVQEQITSMTSLDEWKKQLRFMDMSRL